MSGQISQAPFGTDASGEPIDLYIIDNGTIALHAISLGCAITALHVPDVFGQRADVVLGHDTVEPYLTNEPYVGVVVGRYANRIAGGRFALDGERYQLAMNDGPHHLHGGPWGFHRRLWKARPVQTGDASGVEFSYVSPAGEEGYPGELRASVTYLLSGSAVDVRYAAIADTTTIINLTQHSYFNLAGPSGTDVLEHELTLHAETFTPVDEGLIPTGTIAPVAGTPFDFRLPGMIGTHLQQQHHQLRIANGIDHNFVLRQTADSLRPAASLRDPHSGRRLDVSSTQPGVQVYTGQSLDGSVVGAYGRRFAAHAGLCLETQHFPDSPNHPQFPSTVLRPGERWTSRTRWQFSTADRGER